ncbi:MAG: DUF973 family protein [Sulfolobaceae archaeon]
MSYIEIEALKRLKSANLILIITPILIAIGIITGIVGIVSLTSGGAVSGSSQLASSVVVASVTTLVLIGVLPLVGIILGLIAILKLRGGFRDLKSVFPEAGIGASGGLLLLIGYIVFILFPLGFILAILTISPGLMILSYVGLVLGGIIYFVGQILTGIGFYRVGNRYNESLVSVGGILTIFLPFIGYILNFIGLGKIINKLSMGQQPYSPQPYQQSTIQPSGMPYSQPQYQPNSQPQNLPSVPYQPASQQFPGQQPPLPQSNLPMSPQAPLPIYQTGPFAILRPDGSMTFQVYSSQPAQLVSARIEDTSNTTTTITPNFIQPNQITNVTVNFGSIPIVPGRQYRIIVTAIINNSSIQFPVYANS